MTFRISLQGDFVARPNDSRFCPVQLAAGSVASLASGCASGVVVYSNLPNDVGARLADCVAAFLDAERLSLEEWL